MKREIFKLTLKHPCNSIDIFNRKIVFDRIRIIVIVLYYYKALSRRIASEIIYFTYT